MNEKIRGSFPGGPRKSAPAAERTTAPRLSRVEDIEERFELRFLGRRQGRRRQRALFGFVVSLAIAGGGGVYIGQRGNTTLEEFRAEREAQTAGPSIGGVDMSGINSEVNRTLLELWKMEDVEYVRNPR